MVKALICGGGNGAHVMAGIAAGQTGVTANVLTLFADEAERWTNTMKDSGTFTVVCHQPDGSSVTHDKKPGVVTKDPKAAMEGVDLVVFVVPAFAHAQYLNELKPYVKPGLVLVGMPGQAGFEFAVRGVWGDLARQCTLLSFESLPWACRITSFGKSAEVLGTKATLLGATLPGTTPPPQDATAMLQKCLGPLPKLSATGHLLGITLMGTNGYIHPSIMYGQWHDWDGKSMETPPLFYNGLTKKSADLLTSVSDEVVSIAKAIMAKRKNVDLTNVSHIKEWYLRCYKDDIVDKTSLYSIIQTNKGYAGLTHPTTKQAEKKYVPDFKYRYMLEDIPCGLVVMRGIASVAGVPTPNMDKIILWAQGVMNKEYLKKGEVKGKDLGETRAPQKFNLNTLDEVLGLA